MDGIALSAGMLEGLSSLNIIFLINFIAGLRVIPCRSHLSRVESQHVVPILCSNVFYLLDICINKYLTQMSSYAKTHFPVYKSHCEEQGILMHDHAIPASKEQGL